MKVKDFKGLDLKDKAVLVFESKNDMTIDKIFKEHDRTGDTVLTGPDMIVVPDFFEGFIRDYGDAEVVELRRDSEGYWWMRLEAGEIMRLMPKSNVGALA